MPVAKRALSSARLERGQLPFGPSELGRAQVIEIQRARMLAAMFEVVFERGASSVTVAHVVQRSGVSRRTFYEVFSDCEDCLLAAFEDALGQISARVVPAYENGHEWRERVRAGLVELLCLFDEHPELGRLVVVESLAGGPRLRERRSRLLERLIAIVEDGRAQTGDAPGLPRLTAEGVVGAVGSILYTRLAEPSPLNRTSRTAKEAGQEVEREPLVGLTGPLMGMIVLPHLGKTAARREIARPTPLPRAPVAGDGGANHPFRDLGMRLTYRTLRVLDAVATNPGGSNRMLGAVAGVPDQGQISKLLARLRRLGLVENTGASAGNGAPNAWQLTGKGRDLHRAIETPRQKQRAMSALAYNDEKRRASDDS